MKQWLWLPLFLYVLGLVGWLPFNATDVGNLKPVEVVLVGMEENTVYIRTDTEDCGFGENLSEAIADLKASTSGFVYLETAEYILLGESSEPLSEELGKYLRPGCNVCLIKGDVPLQDVAAFLSVHEPAMTLQQWQSGGGEPDILQMVGGRFYLGAEESNNKAMGPVDSGGNVSAYIADCGGVKLV